MGVSVGMGVAVAVVVDVGVWVGVAVGVAVGVDVAVGVSVGVGVLVTGWKGVRVTDDRKSDDRKSGSRSPGGGELEGNPDAPDALVEILGMLETGIPPGRCWLERALELADRV